MEGEGGGSITIFRQKFFVSWCQNFRRGIPSVSHYFLASKNFRDKRGGWAGITIFRQEFFVSLPKNYVGEPFNLSLISGIETFYMPKKVASRFSAEFFRLAVPKKFVVEPFCAVFQNFSCSEKVYG